MTLHRVAYDQRMINYTQKRGASIRYAEWGDGWHDCRTVSVSGSEVGKKHRRCSPKKFCVLEEKRSIIKTKIKRPAGHFIILSQIGNKFVSQFILSNVTK